MYKTINKLWLFIVVAMSFGACGDDSTEGELALNFKLTHKGQPFVMFQEYDYPTGEKFFLDRVSFYLADISLNEELLVPAAYIDLSNSHLDEASAKEGFTDTLTNVPVGEYTNLNMGFGVTQENNAKLPGDFPSSNVLSRSGEYWPTWSSFVFYKIEGKLDEDGDGEFEKGISLHIGGDEVYSPISLVKEISIDGGDISIVNIVIDINKVFAKNGKVYNLPENNALHSKEEHLFFMDELMTNTVTTMTFN